MTPWQFFIAVCRACLKREGLSFLALFAAVAGAGVLCAMLAWSMAMLEGAKRFDSISWIAYGLLGTVALIIFTLMKLLAGKQAIEAELWQFKFKASQDGDAPAGGA
jgi:hypothetical protein